MDIEEAARRLTAPDGAFAVVDEVVLGEKMSVFRQRRRSLRELLDASSAHGDAEYIVMGDRRISYRQHHALVATFAHQLRHRYGVRAGDRVAILAANCPEWIVAFWAATSLGAIAASMNSLWPQPELDHALAMCDPAVVVCDAARRPSIERARGVLTFRAIVIETELRTMLDQVDDERPLPDTRIDEDDAAVIVYTSGTTGRSKGAVASHRAVCGFVGVNRFAAAVTLATMGIDDPAMVDLAGRQTALVTVPLFHASGVYGFVVNQLAAGGKTVLRESRFDEDDVLRLIEREQVTMWAALGSMGPRVAARAKQSERDLSSLRTLAVGGAPVSPSVQSLLRESFPNAGLNVSMGYTSSEAVAVVSRIQGDDLRDHPTSAGGVVATTEVEIRDESGHAVAEGLDGEIHVRSPYVMLEYWRDAAASVAAIKPGRWLAMGDIGRIEGGRLYINSRARDMMLVNAENVYPTEVEYRLDAHPDVVESAVFGVDDELTGQAIKATVVIEAGSTVGVPELAAWCRDALPGYKVPTQWDVRLEPLPRNPSGKILKRELESGPSAT